MKKQDPSSSSKVSSTPLNYSSQSENIHKHGYINRRTWLKGSTSLVGASLIQTSLAGTALMGCDDDTTSRSDTALMGGENGGERMGDEQDGNQGGQEGGNMGGDLSSQEGGMNNGGDMGGNTGGDIGGNTGGDTGGDMGGEMGGSLPEEPLYIDRPEDPPFEPRFPSGVASGDPLTDRVILWTTIEAEEGEDEIEVEWEMWLDKEQEQSVQSGRAIASAQNNHSVKIDVDELDPDQTYYYQFRTQSPNTEEINRSHLGRTRTLPTQSDRVRLAFCSCANYSVGYFHVYRHLAMQEDLHAVLHLGDYIYESGQYSFAFVRDLEANIKVRTLDEYRNRYAHYRSDPDLQAFHRSHPVIAIWDDHEFANNAWSGGDSELEGEAWIERRDLAKKVYHEWLPTRPTPSDPLYRQFAIGGLVDLWMLDTRIDGREAPLEGREINLQRFTEGRMLIGNEQEEWLFNGLQQSQKPWKILGQQVMMAHLQLSGALQSEPENSLVINTDQWDGFVHQRTRLLQTLQDQNIQGVVVLTGDIHSSWASELTINPSDPLYYRPEEEENSGAVAVELVTPSVSSPGFNRINEGILNLIQQNNPHIKWTQLTKRGFVILDFSETEMESRWYLIDSVDQPELPILRETALVRVRADRSRIDFTLLHEWN